MRDNIQGKRSSDGHKHVRPFADSPIFIEVKDVDGQPRDRDFEMSRKIADRWGELDSLCRGYLQHHFRFDGAYQLLQCTVLTERDRHGAFAVIAYNNEDDRYMYFEIGLNNDLSPVSGLVKYW